MRMKLMIISTLAVLWSLSPMAYAIKVAEVKCSRHAPGFDPESALDENLGTRWSARGENQWIRVELEEPAVIDAVGIAWMNGHMRVAKMDIAVSMDGQEWKQVFSGESRKRKDWLEVYPFEETEVRFIRVTGHGNSANEWNSILELVAGKAAELRKLPEPRATAADLALPIDKVTNEVLERPQITELMTRVNQYMYEHPWRPEDKNWVRATYYTGVVGLYRMTQDQAHLEQARAWCEKHDWSEGGRDTLVNKLTIGQTILELYFIDREKANIAKIRAYADELLKNPTPIQKLWDYCDTLYVGPPTLAMLTKATLDQRYADYMHKAYWDTYDRLFDKKAGLFYRDASYIGKTTANGRKVLWSRGNGWVLGGLPRILTYLPKVDPHYRRYAELLRTMAHAVAKCQRSDGLWTANLADPEQLPGPESSGSAFFCYALAWGLNEGLLDDETFMPVVAKAWKGLAAAVNDAGRLGWVQPIGAGPAYAAPQMTQEYAVGAYLLAGLEMYKLSPKMIAWLAKHENAAELSQPDALKPNAQAEPKGPNIDVTIPDVVPAAKPLAVKVADSVLERFANPPRFDWGEGVLLTGMMDAYKLTGDKRYFAFVKGWADHWYKTGIKATLETTRIGRHVVEAYCGHWGPGLVLTQLYEETNDPRYLEMVNQVITFMINRGERLRKGAFAHFHDDRGLWCDTLYMVCPVLAHTTRIEGKPGYLKEAVHQMKLGFKYLRDPETHLYWHNWNEDSGQNTGHFWARGNGWIVMSLLEILKVQPRDSEDYKVIRKGFAELLHALERYQDPKSGLWHTVVNVPSTYVETSASAMFLYAMVEADGLGIVDGLDKEVMRRAWAGLTTRVDDAGKVIGVSGGTGPSHKHEYYATVPVGTRTWGTGAFLMAARSCAEAGFDTGPRKHKP